MKKSKFLLLASMIFLLSNSYSIKSEEPLDDNVSYDDVQYNPYDNEDYKYLNYIESQPTTASENESDEKVCDTDDCVS